MADNNGFKIDTASVQTEAASVSGLADKLRSAKNSWMADTAGAPSALGVDTLTSAFKTLQTAWAGVFDKYATGVGELGDGIKTSAIKYNSADAYATAHYRQVHR